MPKTFFCGPNDAWPFKLMAVGDIAICTRLRAATTAHSYGNGTRKRFLTRTIKNKRTGELGVRVVRLADNAPKSGQTSMHGTRGPKRKHWPFYDLALGEAWTCNDTVSVRKVEGAVHRFNRMYRKEYGTSRFAMRFKPAPDRTYGAVTVIRVD